MATDQQRKALAVMALAEMFGKPLSEAGARMYVTALADVPADAVERTASQAATTCNRFPPPVELRELAGDARPEDRAALAWEVVLRAISEVGGYRSPDFDDPLINATIRSIGGWVPLCDQTIEQQDRFTRGLFLKTYAGLARTGISDELGGKLAGIFERENATHGFLVDSTAPVSTGLPWAGKPTKKLGNDGARQTDRPRLELRRP